MTRTLLAAAAAALFPVASPALAVDIGSLSYGDQRIYCVAYSFIDLQLRHDNGAVDQASYNREKVRLAQKIQNRGDNTNYAQDFRRLDQAVQQIVAEDPSVGAVSAQAASCRKLLRL